MRSALAAATLTCGLRRTMMPSPNAVPYDVAPSGWPRLAACDCSRRSPRFRSDVAVESETLEGGVQRALADLDYIARQLADAPRDAVSVIRAAHEGPEDEQVERPGKELCGSPSCQHRLPSIDDGDMALGARLSRPIGCRGERGTLTMTKQRMDGPMQIARDVVTGLDRRAPTPPPATRPRTARSSTPRPGSRPVR